MVLETDYTSLKPRYHTYTPSPPKNSLISHLRLIAWPVERCRQNDTGHWVRIRLRAISLGPGLCQPDRLGHGPCSRSFVSTRQVLPCPGPRQDRGICFHSFGHIATHQTLAPPSFISLNMFLMVQYHFLFFFCHKHHKTQKQT